MVLICLVELLSIILLVIQPIHAWTKGWDVNAKFESLGQSQMSCRGDGEHFSAACCVCHGLVRQIELELDQTIVRLVFLG